MSGAEFSRFARDLTRAAASFAGAGAVVAATVGHGALKTAQANAPVETGTLRAGIRMTRRGEVAIVESTVYYSRFIEYGTSLTAPEPFIGPTFDLWASLLVLEVEKIRDKVVGRL
jgi:HK97 gp10 family phage protein